jgi:cyclic-di-GMP-binding protein
MPSFDTVSKTDMHELGNAVDQANREVSTRFDFKGTNASYKLESEVITMTAPSDFQLKQMLDILQGKCTKREIDGRVLDCQDPQTVGQEAKQSIKIKQGIKQEDAKKIVKIIKDKKMKVQASIQGDQVRINGKKRDDLQEVIAMLKTEKLDFPLQFENFRD